MELTAENPVMAEIEAREIIKDFDNDRLSFLKDQEKGQKLLSALKILCPITNADTSTPAGRKAIKASSAYATDVRLSARSARLAAAKSARELIESLNEAGKSLEPAIAEFAELVRAPLTAWEAREESRAIESQAIIDEMKAAKQFDPHASSDSIRELIERIRGKNLNDEVLGPRLEEAMDLRDEAVKFLQETLAHVIEREEQIAELARLREEARIREEKQREDDEQARMARERKEKAERDAEAAAQRQKELEARIEQEKIEAAAQAEQDKAAAVEQARREAAQEAAHKQAEIDRKRQAEIDEANARADKAKADAEAERQRIADAQKAEAEAEAARQEAQRRKEANKAHRKRVIAKAEQGVVDCGADEELAKNIILAIQAGNVPNVILSFAG